MREQDRDTRVLSEVIATRQQAILERWEEEARRDLAGATATDGTALDQLPPSVLRDHLPEVLEELRVHLVGERPADASSAERHASDRLQRGFDIGLLVREYDLLRRCVLEEWTRRLPGEAHSVRACASFQEVLAAFVVQAVSRHLAEEAASLQRLGAGLKARAEQQRALAALGVRALGARELQALFDDAVDTVRGTLGADLAELLELTEDGQGLLLRAGVGWPEDLVGRATLEAGALSESGLALGIRGPVVVEDAAAERRFQVPPLLARQGVRSGVCVAVGAPGRAGRPFGVLGVHARAPGAFTAEDAAFVQAVANVVGTTILRHRSESRAATEQLRGDVHEILAEVGMTLASTLDYEATVQNVGRLGVRHLADASLVELLPARPSEGRGEARVQAFEAEGPPDGCARCAALVRTLPLETLTSPAPDGALLIPALDAAALAALSTAEEPRRALAARVPLSLIRVPLVAHGRMLGALLLVSCDGRRRFGARELQLARDLALRAALALESAQLYAEAREAIQTRDQVLSVVAHDLRNPLGAILLDSADIGRRVPPEGRERVERMAGRIQRAALRADRLIRDLLDLRRLDQGRLELDRAPVRPDEIMASAVEMIAPEAARSSLAVEADPAAALPPIEADRDRVLQVMSNLAGNALKFTPPGGRVRLSARAEDGVVTFSVADSGPGIPNDQLPHLFERFWQGRPRDQRGAGLGLSIAKGIVEAHGGRIWAESAIGRGSTFCFSIPVARRAPS
jgi:signal transduction histidine kinase